MNSLDNRQSHFRVILRPSSYNRREENIPEIMEDAMQPVLQKMKAVGQIYIIHNKDGSGESIFMFKSTECREINLLRDNLTKYLDPLTLEDLALTHSEIAKTFEKKIKLPELKSFERLTRKHFLEEFLKYRRRANYYIKGYFNFEEKS